LFIMPHWPQTEALLRGGDIALAREDTHRWGELVGDVPRFRVGYLRSLAVLAEWDSGFERAIFHLAEAEALANELGLPGERWPILTKLSTLYRANGDETQAHQALTQAAEIVQTLADAIEDENLGAAFTQYGVKWHPPSQAK
jgi:hypothetical protein